MPTRNVGSQYYIQVVKIAENSLIFGSVYPNEQYFEKTFQMGFIPPEAISLYGLSRAYTG